MTNSVEAEAAANSVKSSVARKFPSVEDPRCRHGLVFPSLSPSFEIEPKDRVFTIGSCFARNIEEELARQHIDVPTMHFKTPQDELRANARSNKALNQYNLGTMLQCIRAMEDGANHGGFLARADGMVIDPILATGRIPVGSERAKERRDQIRNLYASELPNCDVAIITLGLAEAWYDNAAGLFLNVTPSPRMVAKEPNRFVFHNLGYNEVSSMLREMVSKIQGYGCRKVLLTVSPVPLNSTYTGRDCVVANMTSKSTLRVAATDIADEFDGIDYFPSYEVVTSGGPAAYREDLRHPKRSVVAKIVSYMLGAYMPSVKLAASQSAPSDKRSRKIA